MHSSAWFLHESAHSDSSCTAVLTLTAASEPPAVRPHGNSPLSLSLSPPQCTQGTKGLLESATRSPLISTSCPQGKPPTAQPCPDVGPPMNPDPSPEVSTSCGARHLVISHGDISPARHSKTRSKRSKRAALHIPNPAFEDPVAPTSLDTGPDSKPRGHKGSSFAPLH